MSLPKKSSPVRSIRVAGLLAILFGVSGILAGLAAAGTFIPYRQGEPWEEFAEVMTVIAAVGAAVSVIGVMTGRGLRRADVWACWPMTLGVAVACVALGLVALGVIAYRWDINLSGLLVVVPYLPGQSTVAYTSYRPSLVEIVTASGVIAYGLLAFSLGVKYLRVVDHRYAEEELEPVKIESTESVPA